MDRNGVVSCPLFFSCVALRKESVDRNFCVELLLQLTMVALRKESVDRNAAGSWRLVMNLLSLSARRAWIEMTCRVDFFFG